MEDHAKISHQKSPPHLFQSPPLVSPHFRKCLSRGALCTSRVSLIRWGAPLSLSYSPVSVYIYVGVLLTQPPRQQQQVDTHKDSERFLVQSSFGELWAFLSYSTVYYTEVRTPWMKDYCSIEGVTFFFLLLHAVDVVHFRILLRLSNMRYLSAPIYSNINTESGRGAKHCWVNRNVSFYLSCTPLHLREVRGLL